VTFFVAYSLEDIMFNQQLLQANKQLQQQQTLPFHIKKRANLAEFDLTFAPSKQFIEFDGDDLFGEFSHNDKHYHYMKLTDGLLLMDVTEQVVVKRGAKDIFLTLVLLFIPCLLISFFIARAISTQALKPFHRLSQHFQSKATSHGTSITQIVEIEETDVKAIAEQLEQALAQQQRLIDEQVTFNLGMSHEIRTPLQVMSHSMELIEANHAELYQQAAMQRLVKSLARIKRISNALLWLTSKDEYQGLSCVNTVLQHVLAESKELTNAHQLNITLEHQNYCQPKISMPEPVLELIFFNLLNNVIHHGKQQAGAIALTISIDKNVIIFSNEQISNIDEQQHFKLGLKLITKLTERFNLRFQTQITENKFKAIFSYH
jgi:signal transduction histidine kinase